MKESQDTIKIKSNRDLGHLTKNVANRVFVLQRQIDPFDDLGFTVHSESGKMTQLMLYNDSIITLSDLEIFIHKKVWDQKEVDSISRDLKEKNIKTFTFIEGYPGNENNYYVVKFGQATAEELPYISYYKVDCKSMHVNKVDTEGVRKK